MYTTFTGNAVVLVHASFTISLDNKPVPVTGVPADAVKPFEAIFVILYVEACGVSSSLASVTPIATSLHIIAV